MSKCWAGNPRPFLSKAKSATYENTPWRIWPAQMPTPKQIGAYSSENLTYALQAMHDNSTFWHKREESNP